MRSNDCPTVCLLIACLMCVTVAAGVSQGGTDDREGKAPAEPTRERITAAVVKALPLLEKGAKGSMEQRPQCFTCHNQGLPILALATARASGFAVDADHLAKQVDFISKFLARNGENYRQGRGQGGQVATAGYALWTLEVGGGKPDATTEAVTEYLLLFDKELDHWRVTSHRPPSEHSHFTANYLAIRGLATFGTEQQKPRIATRIEQARGWLLQTKAQDTEDRVFRLWALKLAGAETQDVRAAVDELLQTQREDGGWAQTDERESDAYATGSALVALHQAGNLAATDPVYRRGLEFLISTQHEDGSWLVRSRSKPFQTYFESGFPHGTDQFISVTASSWATTALALACAPP